VTGPRRGAGTLRLSMAGVSFWWARCVLFPRRSHPPCPVYVHAVPAVLVVLVVPRHDQGQCQALLGRGPLVSRLVANPLMCVGCTPTGFPSELATGTPAPLSPQGTPPRLAPFAVPQPPGLHPLHRLEVGPPGHVF